MKPENNGYRTRQRDLVLEYIRKADRCVTAEEIIRGITESGETVSKPTVYRTLDRFVSDGSVSRYVSEKGDRSTYRFTGDIHSDHFHLKCTECKRTVCVDCAFIKSLESHFLAHHGFTVIPNQTVFYGLCDGCRSR